MASSKKPAPRKRPISLEWQPLTLLGACIRRPDGRKLFVYVGKEDDEWAAMGVEGPDGGDPRAVLDDHGHRMIGQFANAAAAQRAAESFARRWQCSRVKVEECACEDVELSQVAQVSTARTVQPRRI